MGLHRHRGLIAAALGLAGCGTPPAPPAEPAPAAPAAERAEAREPEVPEEAILAEVVIGPEGRDPVGLRALDDGRVQQVRGVGPTLGWRTTGSLAPAQRSELAELLATPGLDRVPPVLSGGGVRGSAPSEWRLRDAKGLRPFRFEAHGTVRAEPFDSLEQLLRSGSGREDVVTRWTIATGATPVGFEVPCDPSDLRSTRSLVNALHDPALPADPDVTTPGAERLAITWVRGLQVERTAWLADGRVVRTSPTGDVRAARLDRRAEAALASRVDALRDPAGRPTCGPTVVTVPPDDAR